MLIGVDGFEVIRAEACFLPFHVVLVDVLIDGLFRCEVSNLEGFVGQKDGAFGAAELYSGGVAVFGPATSGGFDDSTGPIDNSRRATQWSSTSTRSWARRAVFP